MKYRRAAFAQIDVLAHASLSRGALLQYVAYRNSLMTQGEEANQLFALLAEFVLHQYERGRGVTVH